MYYYCIELLFWEDNGFREMRDGTDSKINIFKLLKLLKDENANCSVSLISCTQIDEEIAELLMENNDEK
jgi:hypothetical protein